MPSLSALQVTVTVRQRWWLPLYLHGLLFVCDLLDLEPNWRRVDWWMDRGLFVAMPSRRSMAVQVLTDLLRRL